MRSLLASRRLGSKATTGDSLRSVRVAGRVLVSIAALVLVMPAQAQPPAYVSSRDGLVVIDTGTNTLGTVIAPLAVGDLPAAVTPDGAFLYVSNGNSPGVVSVINAATSAVHTTVPVGNDPAGVALTPDGAFAYVANRAPGTVSVVSTATNSVHAIVGVGAMPSSVAVSPDGAFAYVANRSDGTVSVISTATNEPVGVPVAVGLVPGDLAVSPDGSFLYVASLAAPQLSVVDTATLAITPVNTFAPQSAVAVSPDGAFVYAAVQDGAVLDAIVMIDATATVVDFAPIAACDIALTPDGALLYATRSDGSGVDVFDAATLDYVTSVSGVSGCGITIPQVAAPSGIKATIDVKPATINPRSNQNIQVAVSTDNELDALQVDPETVLFGPEGAHMLRLQAKDVDGDGDADAVFHFQTRATGLTCSATEATFVGKTYDGGEVTGTVSIGMAPCADVVGAAARGSASKKPRRGRGPRDDRL